MAELSFSISAQGVEQYRALAKKLRGPAGTALRKNLRSKIAAAGKPVVDEVKTTVRNIPITSHGGGTAQRRKYNVGRATTARAKKSAERRGAGLRATIASSIKVQQTAKGIRIVAQSSKLPPDQRSLPRHLDSPKGWRHPTFGRRGKDDWVDQKGQPWFAVTIARRAQRFRAGALAAIDETIKEIDS